MSFHIQFCKKCRNILQPEEDRGRKALMLYCRTCDHATYANPDDQFQNCVEMQNYNFRSAEDIKSYIIPGMEKDPTLPRDKTWQCPSCGQVGALYFQLPERVADDAMTLVFVCGNCAFYEVKGKVADRDDDTAND